MKKPQRIYLALILLTTQPLAIAGDLPNKALTPGTIDPSISQSNIQTTICVRGYTKTIRPPSYFTNRLKKKQMHDYGYADHNPAYFEEDHLIPLSIGGNPSDPANLWPQPRMSEWNAEKKDILEFKLYKLVCEGALSLNDARHQISADWIEAYKRYVK